MLDLIKDEGKYNRLQSLIAVRKLIIIEYYIVKPGHAVTSIKQSPVLKGHHFLVLP